MGAGEKKLPKNSATLHISLSVCAYWMFEHDSELGG
jgi:hypothetical protein